MTKSKGFWASLLIFPLAIALLSSSPLTAATDDDAVKPLKECLNVNPSSSWLFLVDASQSLRVTDPDNSRADALETAITELNSNSRKKVYIALLEFGTTTSSANQVPWALLDDESKDGLVAVARSFEPNEFDTDYLGALKEAIAVLDKAEDNSCKVLVWFSDGELSLEPGFAERSGTTDSLKDWEPIQNKTQRKNGEKIILDLLCKKNGVVDDLRGSGKGGLIDGKSTFIWAIGLKSAESESSGTSFNLMRAIAENLLNSDEKVVTDHKAELGKAKCGESLGLGKFEEGLVTNLEKIFYEAVNQPDTVCDPIDRPCKLRNSFNISRNHDEFVLWLTQGEGVTASIQRPDEKKQRNILDIFDDSTKIEPKANNNIKLTWKAPDNRDENWDGKWLVSFDRVHPGNDISMKLVIGDLTATLANNDLRVGREPVLTFKVEPPNVQELQQGSMDRWENDDRMNIDLQVQLRGTDFETILKAEQDESEKTLYRVSGKIPLPNISSIECSTRLVATFKVTDDISDTIENPRKPGAWNPCGENLSLEVKKAPSFPTQQSPVRTVEFSPPLDAAGNRESSGEINFIANAPNEFGKICFDDDNVEFEDESLPEITITAPGQCLVFGTDTEPQPFILSAESTENQLSEHFNKAQAANKGEDKFSRIATITFISTSEDGKTEEKIYVRVSVPVRHQVKVNWDWGQIIPWIIFSFLLPFLLLYAYNFFWGSRFSKSGPIQVADISVRLSDNKIISDAGTSRICESADFSPHPGAKSLSKTFIISSGTAQIAELVGQVPILPHSEPTARARFLDQQRRLVFCELGSSKNSLFGRLKTSISPAWILGVEAQQPQGDQQVLQDHVARLVITLPADSTQNVDSAINDLVIQINSVLDSHAEQIKTWLQKEQGISQTQNVENSTLGKDPQDPEQPLSSLPDEPNGPLGLTDLPD